MDGLKQHKIIEPQGEAAGPGLWQGKLEALCFDVFGTCVDWRSSIQEALTKAAADKMRSSAFSSLPVDVQTRARDHTEQQWADFSQAWRTSYGKFTHGFVAGQTEWKDIDTHHHDSLVDLLSEWQLDGLFGAEEIVTLSRAWHYLRPWPDSGDGIQRLGKTLVTATLSNGNHALLADLNAHGKLGFQKLISAEDFRAYKPAPSVYLGACETLGLQPGQVAMVAAHLGDLAAARSCGLRTIYVERSGEEAWRPDESRYQEARKWVDIWMSHDDDGFVGVARKLGIE